MKQDAQVVLYRKYRLGDLPDIQIKHSSLIAPLQAVAQVSASRLCPQPAAQEICCGSRGFLCTSKKN